MHRKLRSHRKEPEAIVGPAQPYTHSEGVSWVRMLDGECGPEGAFPMSGAWVTHAADTLVVPADTLMVRLHAAVASMSPKRRGSILMCPGGLLPDW